MGKYSVADIVDGQKTLANGAVAGYVMADGKRVWRIISGANDMSAARNAPRRKDLSQRAAVRAFNKHYKNKAYKTERARKAAMTRDMCSSNQPLKSTTSYRRSPHKYDFAGVDDGSRCKGTVRGKKQPSQAQLDALARGRAKRAANLQGGARGRKKGSRNKPQKHCGFNQETMRCSKAANGKNNEWCTVGRKSKRCKKSTRGKTSAPKRVASQAQLDALARGRAVRDANRMREMEGGARGRKRGSKNKAQRVCGLNEETMRCSKASNGNKNRLCTVGRKSGRCKKSTAGKADNAHKNPANVARGKALMANLRETNRVARGRRASPKKSAKRGRPSKAMKVTSHEARLGKKGSACRGLSKKDCGRHPACDYRKFGKAKSPSCGRKKQ